MKPYKMTVEELMKDLVEHMGESLPTPVGADRPVTAEEQIAAREALTKFALEGRVLCQCIGCDQPVEAAKAALCTCGGFVCPACRAVEEEGVCTHERPACLPPADDDEDD